MKSDNFMIFYIFELVPMKWSLFTSMIFALYKKTLINVLHCDTCQSSQINHSVQMGFLSCLKT